MAEMHEVGKILPALFRTRVRRGGSPALQILAPLWPRVAGKAIAQHSRLVAFESGTLTLLTTCPSWAGQLRQMVEEIRAEINSFLGEPIVKKLRIEHRESYQLAGLPRRQPEGPAKRMNQLEVVEGAAQLSPEMARIIQHSFTKYFARNGKRIE